MYPTPQEQAIIHEAEKIMIETMARYDPSHDQYHGESGTWPQPSRVDGPIPYDWTRFYSVQRVRKTALALAKSISPTPDLLTVELGLQFSDTESRHVLTCVLLAALLHDVLDKKYVTDAQAADPYAYFQPFFTSIAALHGVDLVEDGRDQIIAKIISNVSWTTENKLRDTGEWTEWHDTCLELHCVQDADRLDAIGAFGKCLLVLFHTTLSKCL